MNPFKDIAWEILKETGKPLNSKDITKIALERGWLKTAGKTPEATMNAQLVYQLYNLTPEEIEIVEGKR
jgi:restriction system protein